MKYFVDDDHWDVMGYVKELKRLLPRFNKETSNFFFGGRKGLDDWGYDEILPLSKRKLQHEILLVSQTKILIHCSDIKIRKIKT